MSHSSKLSFVCWTETRLAFLVYFVNFCWSNPVVLHVTMFFARFYLTTIRFIM
nr:MAG TPA: hypothetical protein [Caudoviricetes sp.]